MKKNIKTLEKILMGAFILVCLGLIYWQLIQSQTLLARDDNPRRIIAEQQIRRGKIITIDNIPLAESIIAEDGTLQRRYPYPNLAAVTGYYHIRYGTGGLEAAFDSHLRGETDWLDGLMHRPSIGENITVTIQLQAQVAADIALAKEADTTGAVIVLNAQSGVLLVMASHPTFNPNNLNQEWDNLLDDPAAPLINRATQGIFPLGEMVRVVLLIGLLEADIPLPADPWTAPLDSLLESLKVSGLLDIAQQLHLEDELSFHTPSNAGFIPKDIPDKVEEIAITPLHLALIGAAITQQGLAPTPTLVHPNLADSQPSRPPLFDAATASTVYEHLTEYSSLASPEVTGNEPLSWYLGITNTNPPLITVVVVTTPISNPQAAAQIAQATLNAVK